MTCWPGSLKSLFELLLCTAVGDCKAGDEGHLRAINPASGALPFRAHAAEQPCRAMGWRGADLLLLPRLSF